MLRQGLRVRDGEIDREVEERVGASAPADRRFVCAFGGAGAKLGLFGGPAEWMRTEEQLAGSGVGRGSFALWDAVSTGSLALGRQCSPDRPDRLCEGRVRGSRCSIYWIARVGTPVQ